MCIQKILLYFLLAVRLLEWQRESGQKVTVKKLKAKWFMQMSILNILCSVSSCSFLVHEGEEKSIAILTVGKG